MWRLGLHRLCDLLLGFRQGRLMMNRQKPRVISVVNVCLFLLVVYLAVPALLWVNYRNPYILHTLSSQSEQLHSWLANGSLENLQVGCPPVTVHYLWCQEGYFEFKHYVSILSIVKLLQPDQIVFHYTRLPLANPKSSVTWFEDIQRDVTFLTLNKDSNSHDCGSVDKHQSFSGIIIREDVAVVNFTRLDFLKMAKYSPRHSDFRVLISSPSDSLASRVMQDGGAVVPCVPQQDQQDASPPAHKIQCVHLSDNLSPSDTWTRQGQFYTFVKELVYGPKSLQPKSNYEVLLPLDCHILHLTNSFEFDYTAYASVMSALRVGGLNHVYLHSDRPQSGPLIEDVMKTQKVTLVHVPHLQNFHPTEADVVYGAYVLLRHGGVVVRSDTIWRKQIPADIRGYDSSATRPSSHTSTSSSLDLSVLISKTNSDFLKLLVSTLRQTRSNNPHVASGELAYKVYTERPDSVNIRTNLVQHVRCSSSRQVCEASPADEEGGGAVFVQLSWNGERPRLKSDLEVYREKGTSFLPEMLKYTS